MTLYWWTILTARSSGRERTGLSHRIAVLVMETLAARGKVIIETAPCRGLGVSGEAISRGNASDHGGWDRAVTGVMSGPADRFVRH